VEDSIAAAYLQDVLQRFRHLKSMADSAIEQTDHEAFTAAPDPGANSIALIVKHVAGNMRSRWRDFLTSDGEKPDRHRDTEFEIDPEDTRAAVLARWEAGWDELFQAVEPLTARDLGRTVHIRREPHLVIEAINRQLGHYAYHVGQIVFLAKHLRGKEWQWLSIPPGKSQQYNDGKQHAPR
jgi:hypothetical protein